uniref:Uncharacterized protein n=1 Tax=Anguilla anguilla TaxID=7936 RepID=A0A0E9XFS9_ANGAN
MTNDHLPFMKDAWLQFVTYDGSYVIYLYEKIVRAEWWLSVCALLWDS